MSDLMKAMALMIEVFYKYSEKEGDKNSLTKTEVKELINKELGDILGKANDQAAIDRIFKSLDSDGSGIVDFQEYATLIACLTMACQEQLGK